MSQIADPLQSADLAVLLRALPPGACDRIATLMVGLRRRSPGALRDTYLPRSLETRKLCGHQLIPDIVDDLSALGRHETGPSYTYRQLLQDVAARHGIQDDGECPPAGIERKVQRHYAPDLWPDPANFEDRGSDAWWRRAAYGVPVGGWAAYLLSPDWKVVTAVTLEVAAHRRIALTRDFRENLED